MPSPYISRPAHLLILAAVPAGAGALSMLARRKPASGRMVRFGLAGLIVANEMVWYAYEIHSAGFQLAGLLPLQLCDLMLVLTVIAALGTIRWAYDIAYFCGIGGSGMALITPDLWSRFPSYPAVYFFLSHGLVVMTLLMLAGSRMMRPRPGSLWRAYAVLNIYAALVAAVDVELGTNFMYLCEKPANASLLNFLGPWPVYVFAGDAVALALFWFLWLPVRPGNG